MIASSRTFHPLLLSIISACCILAQTPTGSVSGSVADGSGAQIANAAVRIINNATNESRTVNTSSTGSYVFPSVAAGEYSLDAQSVGFQSQRRTGITLNVNQNARVDFILQIGSVKDVVEVKGNAPLVDTMDVQVGETVDQDRIENLPLNGRNVYDLIGLMPGAVNVTTSVTGTNDSNNMNVNHTATISRGNP